MNLPGFQAQVALAGTTHRYASTVIAQSSTLEAADWSQFHDTPVYAALGRGCPGTLICCGGRVDGEGFCLGDCCPRGRTCCGQTCADFKIDPDNCGRCGNSCPSGICTGGQCAACPQGQTACGGRCCPSGQCGCDGVNCCTAQQTCCSGNCCDPGQSCCNGQCCSAGQTCCGGACCPNGDCCNGNCCQSGQVCCSGQCVTPGGPRNGFSWCGQSSPTVVECNCPTGFSCRPICQGQLCSVDWYCQPDTPPPVCTISDTRKCTLFGFIPVPPGFPGAVCIGSCTKTCCTLVGDQNLCGVSSC